MYDTILAKSQSIIYQPGGVTGGLVVTTWAQVQEFIAYREGTVIVYVDDSIVSPALVPGATGITDCQGRVILMPALADSVLFAILQVEPGATLQDLYKVAGMELRCNPQTAVNSLSFTSTNGGFLFITDGAFLSNAATATTPAVDLAALKILTFDFESQSIFVLGAPAVPFVRTVATATFNVFAFDATTIGAGVVDGAGTQFNLFYDNSSATSFPTPGTPPAQAGFTGTYNTTNTDNIWAQKPIDAATFNAPVDAQLPIFDGVTQTWRSISMSGGATIDRNGVVTLGAVTLTGNANGPSGANRFLSLTLLGNDADVNVVDTEGWYFVRMTGLTANRTVTLPAAPTSGMVVVVKDGDGSLSSFNIVIDGNGNTIDGAATYTMTGVQNLPKGSVSLQYDGTAPNAGWFLF